MKALETTIYALAAIALCLAGVYYMGTGQESTGLLYPPAIMLLCAWVVVRVLWVSTASNRRMKKILKEIEMNRNTH